MRILILFISPEAIFESLRIQLFVLTFDLTIGSKAAQSEPLAKYEKDGSCPPQKEREKKNKKRKQHIELD